MYLVSFSITFNWKKNLTLLLGNLLKAMRKSRTKTNVIVLTAILDLKDIFKN